jgi:molybdenum cofactor cytidylyltransferase
VGTAINTGITKPGLTLAVVLAAGAGSRFTGEEHKLNSRIGGTTISEWAIRAAHTAQIGPLIVITGATTPKVNDPDLRPTLIHNPHWAEGQSTSLQVAINYARSIAAAAVVIGLGDQPFIHAACWRAVASSTSPIAVASFREPDGSRRRSNPVRLAAGVWDALPTSGDYGARELIQMRPDLVEAIPCEGSPADIDTMEDLQRWQNSSSTNSP